MITEKNKLEINADNFMNKLKQILESQTSDEKLKFKLSLKIENELLKLCFFNKELKKNTFIINILNFQNIHINWEIAINMKKLWFLLKKNLFLNNIVELQFSKTSNPIYLSFCTSNYKFKIIIMSLLNNFN